MVVFPGFRLPDELRALREQVRRFVRDEIIPLEQQLDPDAPDIPREHFARLLIDREAHAAGEKAHGGQRRNGYQQREHQHAQLAGLPVAEQRQQREPQRLDHDTNLPASILMMRLHRLAMA